MRRALLRRIPYTVTHSFICIGRISYEFVCSSEDKQYKYWVILEKIDTDKIAVLQSALIIVRQIFVNFQVKECVFLSTYGIGLTLTVNEVSLNNRETYIFQVYVR